MKNLASSCDLDNIVESTGIYYFKNKDAGSTGIALHVLSGVLFVPLSPYLSIYLPTHAQNIQIIPFTHSHGAPTKKS